MIELSRNINFGQYINNGSLLTRLDPRVKLLGEVLLIGLVSYIGSFTAFALVLLFCTLIQWTSHISLRYVLRGFKGIVIFLVIIYIIEVLFYPSSAHQLWQWGIFNISWEGIIANFKLMLRVVFLYYLASLLLFTTSLLDLTDGSEALLSPLQKIGIPVNAFVMVLVIAFKFVPIFVTEVERLMKAQAARGVRFDQGNFIQRTLKIGPLLIPLILNGFKRAETLSTAMEARCYAAGNRGWRRSKRKVLHFQRHDIVALIVTIGFCVITVIVTIFARY